MLVSLRVCVNVNVIIVSVGMSFLSAFVPVFVLAPVSV